MRRAVQLGMTNRFSSLGVSILFALTTGACVGALDDDQDSSDTPSNSAPDSPEDLSQGRDDSAAADAEPIGEADAAPAEIGMATEALEGSCLTFYTADEGVASSFEDGLQAAITGPKVVYLNRTGGTYTRGRNDSSRNVSSIPDRTVSVPAYEGSAADWQNVVSCVVDQFKDYNIRITDQDPGDTSHIETVVGGGPEALGFPSGVGGVSPFTCGLIERSIVFVFSRVLRSVRSECEVIAHEIGHSIGLEHEFLCQDPMTYLSGCGAKSFQDQAAACGTSRAVDCECGSRTQNTVQKLLANVGPASATPPPAPPPPPPPATDALPTVRVVSPASGATLPGNSELVVTVQASDDVGVSDVRLLWELQGTRILSCRDAAAPVTCTSQNGIFTFKFPVGTGARAFVAEAVDTAQQTAKSPRIQLTFTDSAAVDSPPVVSISQPTQGATLRAGTRFSVRAQASDDGSVRQVNLIWRTSTGSQTFRLENLGAGTYGVDLTLSAQASPGTRSLSVTAMDDAGQTTTSASVTVNLVR